MVVLSRNDSKCEKLYLQSSKTFHHESNSPFEWKQTKRVHLSNEPFYNRMIKSNWFDFAYLGLVRESVIVVF